MHRQSSAELNKGSAVSLKACVDFHRLSLNSGTSDGLMNYVALPK